MTTLFISDLHLTPARPDITDCFIEFMHNEAPQAEALYVLGDLFEFWIGDDDDSEFSQQIRDEFTTLSKQGVALYFIQGNRDFLLGKRFCQSVGMTLLDDVTTIDLYGEKTLILHGDTLCIDDLSYQKFRAKVHQPWLQWVFNRIPWFIKKRIVAKVQTGIKEDKQHKNMQVMDVNYDEVLKVMDEYQVKQMIHGHTHRPAHHKIEHNASTFHRIVLGDWYQQGSILVVDEKDLKLTTRKFS